MDRDDDAFDYEITNLKPSPTECQNEITSIESFYKCFMDCYNACPVFFMGSLQDACELAFNSSIIKERRPVLVYIHHDKSLFSNIFCSEIMIDYLLENYILWPWDITCESNQNTLMRIWKDLFSTEIPVDQCSMLIGIMQTLDIEKCESLKSRYQFRLVLENNKLIRTQEKVNLERLLNELIIFKEQFDENEQNLSFDFATTTGLSWDLILEITKYLTLKDAIIAFSPKILSLFYKYKTKLHLSEPSKPLIDLILQTLNPEQIISLQFNATRFWSKTEFSSLRIFTHITSLILYNIKRVEQFYHYEEFFPNLTYLSLYYDNEIINIGHLSVIISRLQRSIKRLEIHCAASSYPRYFQLLLNLIDVPQTTIEYFLIDIHHFPVNLTNQCYMNHQSCFSIQILNLIKMMKNIRYIHLIANKYNIENLLDVNVWKMLISNCCQLKKVTVKVIGTILQDEKLIQKIFKIQNIQQTIKFQVLFL